jgi:hypothetical protein
VKSIALVCSAKKKNNKKTIKGYGSAAILNHGLSFSRINIVFEGIHALEI